MLHIVGFRPHPGDQPFSAGWTRLVTHRDKTLSPTVKVVVSILAHTEAKTSPCLFQVSAGRVGGAENRPEVQCTICY